MTKVEKIMGEIGRQVQQAALQNALVITHEDYARARAKIVECEKALNHRISMGEMRDLLKDNFEWTSQKCNIIADACFDR